MGTAAGPIRFKRDKGDAVDAGVFFIGIDNAGLNEGVVFAAGLIAGGAATAADGMVLRVNSRRSPVDART